MRRSNHDQIWGPEILNRRRSDRRESLSRQAWPVVVEESADGNDVRNIFRGPQVGGEERMKIEFHWWLDALLRDFNVRLDEIQREAVLKFRHLARSTGQYTRTDRATK